MTLTQKNYLAAGGFKMMAIFFQLRQLKSRYALLTLKYAHNYYQQ